METHHQRSLRQRGRRIVLMAAVLVLAGFWLRTADLLGMPLYVDEAYHIGRAHRIALGDFFNGLEHSKWLYTAVLAAFRPLGSEGPFIARWLSALCAGITIAGTMALGRHQGGAAVGLLAGVLYGAFPLAVFNDRQALVDPTLTSLTTLSLWLTLRQIKHPGILGGLLLCLALTAAYLTKGAALPFLILPLVAFVFWGQAAIPGQGGRVWWRLAWCLLAVAIPLGVGAVVLSLARLGGYTGTPQTHQPLNLALGSLLRLADWQETIADLGLYTGMLFHYLGLAGAALVAVGGIAVAGKHWRNALFLAIPAIGFGAAYALSDPPNWFRQIEGRYLLVTIPPLVVWLALSLAWLWEWLSGWPAISRGARLALLALVMGAMAAHFARLDWLLVRDPLTGGGLFHRDQFSYDELHSGAEEQVAERILSLRDPGRPLQVIGAFQEIEVYQAYIGVRGAGFTRYQGNDRNLPLTMLGWEAADNQMFLAVNPIRAVLPPGQFGATLDFVQDFPSRRGEVISLYEVREIGLHGEAAAELRGWLAPPPESVAEELAELRAAILGGDETNIFVYPERYVMPLATGLTGWPVFPLTQGVATEAWPATFDEAGFLRFADADAMPARFDVVMVEADRIDPNRAIKGALEAEGLAYRIEENWYGPIRHTRFVGAWPAPEACADYRNTPLGGEIRLLRACIDASTLRGGTVRVALDWQTDSPVATSYKVFAHLLGSQGELVAQADGVPGGGLLPTTGWVPGGLVQDRFALALSTDLAPGRYILIAGLYDPLTGERLPVLGSAGINAIDLGIVLVSNRETR